MITRAARTATGASACVSYALTARAAWNFAAAPASRARLSSSAIARQEHPVFRPGAAPAASSTGQQGYAGPFPLPNAQKDALFREEKLNQAARQWSQLNGRQKLGRAATNTTSLFVVLGGGLLTAVLVYALSSELGSSNSPTRIYEDCIARLQDSEELHELLIEPLRFHGSSSGNRWQRNRSIAHGLTVDPSDGQEVLTVSFWVEGSPNPERAAAMAKDDSLWYRVKEWVGPLVWEDSRKPGSYVPQPTQPPPPPPTPPPEDRTWVGSIKSSVKGAFSALVPRLKSGASTVEGMLTRKPKRGHYTSGECVAILKRDPQSGNFVYQDLFVDVPNSRERVYRVTVPTHQVGEPRQGVNTYRLRRVKAD